MLEETWARAYSKAVRAQQDVDTALFREEKWERKLQKVFCDQGYIKTPSSGNRYRYDLYGNNTRDTTYVVAVPASLLDL